MTEETQHGLDSRSGGAAIRVVVDDLAFLAVDAVIRPADDSLQPVTPTASRLDQVAGPRFAQQRRVSAPLEAGAAVVTGGGDLSAPFVIHIVIRDDVSDPRPEIVRRALVSAWQRAKDWQLANLAAPLVGAGAGQLGVEESAQLLAETFAAAHESGASSTLAIVVDRESDREIVEAIVRRFA